MELTFRDIGRDIERWMHAYGTPDTLEGTGTKVLRGLDKAESFVLDAYFQRKAYDALIAHVVGFNQIVNYENPLLTRLTEALVADKELAKINKLWRGVIAKRKIGYFETAAYHKKMPDKVAAEKVERDKAWVSKGFNDYANTVEKLGGAEAKRGVLTELADFEEGKRAKIKGTPDPRKIDEELFWSLIADSSAPTVSEHLEALAFELQKFKGTSIQQFVTLLADKMLLSYHWDIWALAFLAQDGCSDDAFEGFRAWLILQGRSIFTDAVSDVSQIVHHVPSGLATDAQQLLLVPEIAYERRVGKPMRPRRTKVLSTPHGEKWEEAELPQRYPKLWRFYDRR